VNVCMSVFVFVLGLGLLRNVNVISNCGVGWQKKKDFESKNSGTYFSDGIHANFDKH